MPGVDEHYFLSLFLKIVGIYDSNWIPFYGIIQAFSEAILRNQRDIIQSFDSLPFF